MSLIDLVIVSLAFKAGHTLETIRDKKLIL